MSDDEELEVVANYPVDDHLSAYFRELGDQPRLSRDEELHLAEELETAEIDTWRWLLTTPTFVLDKLPESLRKEARLTRLINLRFGRERKTYLRELERAAKRIRALDLDRVHVDAVMNEHWRLIPPVDLARAKEGYAAATAIRNRFVTSNLLLVVTVARRYAKGARLTLADLIQEGNLGLIHSIARFNHRRELRFSTYACWWIRHRIGRAMADKGREVRIPVHMQETSSKLANARHRLTGELGRPPTNEELSKATKVPLAQINQEHHFLTGRAVPMSWSPRDIDGPLDEQHLEDTLQDPDSEEYSPEDTLTNEVLSKDVVELMNQLSPIEQDVLRQRFGFDGGEEEVTLRTIGVKHGLSRERIRQIQKEAVEKLRRAMALRHGGELER